MECMCDLRGIINFKLATYHYDEDHWNNESPYKVCIIPQPAPAIDNSLHINCYSHVCGTESN